MKYQKPTLQTRKPIDSITASDMRTFPIWEFALDEEADDDMDETWVRPVDAKTVRKGKYSLSVSAEFRTNSGLVILGLIGVSTDEGVEIAHPVLLPKGAYLYVDFSSKASRKATASALGLTVKELFPLTYTLQVRIGREKVFRTGSFV